jgi:bacillithiol biosynthesis cysteine-adding enzyme BshC
MLSSSFDLLSIGSLPALVKDYFHGAPAVKKFYKNRPNVESIIADANSRSFAQRETLVAALKRQNAHYSNHPLIERLLQENSFTVTTGHQLCVATGPLYFLYKIASTIALARKLAAEDVTKAFIPVYWMASEDHDFEEIQSIEIFQKKIIWNAEAKGPVGRLDTEGLESFIEELTQILGTSVDALRFIDILKESYSKPSLAAATRHLVYSLFGDQNLIVLDADDAELKKIFLPIIQKEIKERFSFELVKKTSAELEALGYKAQVTPREVNLFYIEKGIRERIKFEDGNFHWGLGSQSLDDLISLTTSQPESISPNVILRPVYQECILPNLAYVGGPGELSYWLQLREVFDFYNIPFPTLLLRDSALLLSTATLSKLSKLNLEIENILNGKNAIIQSWIQESNAEDLSNDRFTANELFDSITAKMKALDPTLESSAAGERKKLISAIENLEKKMIRAIKSKEEVRIQQLEKIFTELFPGDQPQERVTNVAQYTDFLEAGLINYLVEVFDPTQLKLTVVRSA